MLQARSLGDEPWGFGKCRAVGFASFPKYKDPNIDTKMFQILIKKYEDPNIDTELL